MPGPQLLGLFGKVVEPSGGGDLLEEVVLQEMGLLFTLCFLTTDAVASQPPAPAAMSLPCEGLPNCNCEANESSPSLNCIFSSHRNKKSGHYNHLRGHVTAFECWKNIHNQTTA